MNRSVRFLGPLGILGVGLLIAGALVARSADDTSAAQGATVSLLPSSQNVQLGETFTIDVAIDNATNLAAYEFRITYDPNILTIEGVTQTDFLRSTGRGVSCPPIGDEAARKTTDVWFGCATVNKSSGSPVGGSGVLAHISFSAKGPGLTYLTFVKLQLADDMSDDCCAPVSLREAAVRVIAPDEPTPDHLPPTPTLDPAALTPAPNPAASTPSGRSWLLTPEPGETPMTRPIDGMNTTGANTSSPGRSGGAAQGTAGSPAGGSPRAGEGPPEKDAAWWPVLIGGLLAAAGAALLPLAAYLGGARLGRRN
jgi:hypothetical protein